MVAKLTALMDGLELLKTHHFQSTYLQ